VRVRGRPFFIAAACLILAWTVPAARAVEKLPTVYEEKFEGKNTWQAVPGIEAKVIELGTRAGKGLHLTGTQKGLRTYTASPGFRLQPGGKYRLGAWVYVRKAAPQHAPYLRVEFVAIEGDKWLWEKYIGRAASDPYDLDKGKWQHITLEFSCPMAASGGWVGLEKGTDEAVEIDAALDDVTVHKIGGFTNTLKFDPVPRSLATNKNLHPRLHYTAKRVQVIKSRGRKAPYPYMMREIRAVAEKGFKNGPPSYKRHDDYSGDEQLWQRDVGNMIPHLAMMYVFTGDRTYLKSAKAWMLASAGYESWGLGAFEGKDLAAGHQLYGMALGYDWLYKDLDPKTRATIRDCLAKRGQYMFEQVKGKQVYWHDKYLQNDLWVNMTGLAAAGLALYGEVDEAESWIVLALQKMQKTMESLGPDGATHLGVPYWSYGLESLLKFADLARDLLDRDFYKDSAWLKNTGTFRLYSALPVESWQGNSTVLSFGDGPRVDWYGPEYMLRRLATHYRDAHIQWLATDLDTLNLCGDQARFLNPLWADPHLYGKEPDRLPTFKHFEDMGLVFMRSGWMGDESVFAFKCGPHIGHHALKKYSYDPGSGHVHPDAGAFQLFGFGDWLIVDDGYAFKMTAYQNTALVNDSGQIGEGRGWFEGAALCARKRGAKILRAESNKDMDYVIGDVTAAYPDEAGLRKFIRHVLYLKPSCWVIIDEFEAAKPAKFEVLLHADFPFQRVMANVYEVKGKKGALTITVPGPRDAVLEAGEQTLKDPSGAESGKLNVLRIRAGRGRAKDVFITVLDAHAASRRGTVQTALQGGAGKGDVLVVKTRARTWRFALDPDRRDPASPIWRGR